MSRQIKAIETEKSEYVELCWRFTTIRSSKATKKTVPQMKRGRKLIFSIVPFQGISMMTSSRHTMMTCILMIHDTSTAKRLNWYQFSSTLYITPSFLISRYVWVDCQLFLFYMLFMMMCRLKLLVWIYYYYGVSLLPFLPLFVDKL